MHVSFQISNDLVELHTVQEQIKTLQSAWLLSPRAVTEINLVLEEIIANIVAHGGEGKQQITISLAKDGQELTMTVVDQGPTFDPTICAPADTSLPLQHRKTGGLGLHLVRSFCQGCSYSRENNANILTLKRTLPKENR